MDAIKLIGTSHHKKLTVDVPEEFDNKELEIMIISSKVNMKIIKEENKKLKESKKHPVKLKKILN